MWGVGWGPESYEMIGRILNSIKREEVARLANLDCDKPPKHILEPTVISSRHFKEFMVSRISSVVLILLEPLMDKFTLMEVF